MFFGQEFLRNPDRYIRVGARPPRGVLLVSFSKDWGKNKHMKKISVLHVSLGNASLSDAFWHLVASWDVIDYSKSFP